MKRLALAAAGAAAAWYALQPPAVDVGAAGPEGIRRAGEYAIKPLQHYTITARVLSTKRYSIDKNARVSPLDLALGWGPMSENRLLDHIEIEQKHRWYYFRWGTGAPKFINRTLIAHNSANTHIIPASRTVLRDIKRLGSGDYVTLQGQLVTVTGENGWSWTSSLSRTDSGAGACELFLVTDVQTALPEEALKQPIAKPFTNKNRETHS